MHELLEAHDERRLPWLETQRVGDKLLVLDELAVVPPSKIGAKLLFELIWHRYEPGGTLIASNLPVDEWTEIFGSERLTGVLPDRSTRHVNRLDANGENYHLNQSHARTAKVRT